MTRGSLAIEVRNRAHRRVFARVDGGAECASSGTDTTRIDCSVHGAGRHTIQLYAGTHGAHWFDGVAVFEASESE